MLMGEPENRSYSASISAYRRHLKIQWKTFTNMKLMNTDISLTLSPVGGSKDDKTAPLERGSVATCGLKTEGNTLYINYVWDHAHAVNFPYPMAFPCTFSFMSVSHDCL